jgi:hypothetical protein
MRSALWRSRRAAGPAAALNREQKITAAFAGDLFEEHAAACVGVRNTAMCAVDSPFDVVVTTNSGYPLDQNLYQAVKGMSAAARIVKENKKRADRKIPHNSIALDDDEELFLKNHN